MTSMSQIARTATATVGALLISTACIAAAIGPAAAPVQGAAVAQAQTSDRAVA